MIYSIENKYLKVEAETAGAQLKSVYSKETGREYLWQGDPAYWTGRAYNLFPTIGRMFKNVYTYDGQTYEIQCHGLARYYAFKLYERTATKMTFLFTDNEDTRKEYPFRFEFYITFALDGKKLTVSHRTKNVGEKTLIFAVGGHPGINVPFGEGEFEDYYIEFAEKSNVAEKLLSENKFMDGRSAPYPLTDGTKIALRHSLFDNDAIVLSNTCRKVSIKSKKDPAVVSMDFTDFKYFGIWHMPETDAPYVCLEPWSALPATEGKIDQLEEKEDMTHLAPNQEHVCCYTIEIDE